MRAASVAAFVLPVNRAKTYTTQLTASFDATVTYYYYSIIITIIIVDE